MAHTIPTVDSDDSGLAAPAPGDTAVPPAPGDAVQSPPPTSGRGHEVLTFEAWMSGAGLFRRTPSDAAAGGDTVISGRDQGTPPATASFTWRMR